MSELNISDLQKSVEYQMLGTIVCFFGNRLVIKKKYPIWEESPYIITNFTYNPESLSNKYTFYSSNYDLNKEQVSEILAYEISKPSFWLSNL